MEMNGGLLTSGGKGQRWLCVDVACDLGFNIYKYLEFQNDRKNKEQSVNTQVEDS